MRDSQDRRTALGDAVVTAALTMPGGWKTELRLRVDQAFYAGEAFGRESRVLEEREGAGADLRALEVAVVSAFRTRGGEFGPAIARLMVNMDPADARRVMEAVAGAAPPTPAPKPATGEWHRNPCPVCKAESGKWCNFAEGARRDMRPQTVHPERIAAHPAMSSPPEPEFCPRCAPHPPHAAGFCAVECAACVEMARIRAEHPEVVPCPVCHAPVGQPCTTAGTLLPGSGLRVGAGFGLARPHASRVRAAVAQKDRFRCSRCRHVHDEEFDCESDCVTCGLEADARELAGELATARQERKSESGAVFATSVPDGLKVAPGSFTQEPTDEIGKCRECLAGDHEKCAALPNGFCLCADMTCMTRRQRTAVREDPK